MQEVHGSFDAEPIGQHLHGDVVPHVFDSDEDDGWIVRVQTPDILTDRSREDDLPPIGNHGKETTSHAVTNRLGVGESVNEAQTDAWYVLTEDDGGEIGSASVGTVERFSQ